MKTKRILNWAILGVIYCQLSLAQLTTRDVFNSNEVVWYGLDFSEAKFVGHFNEGFGVKPINEYELINKYIPAWNHLVVMEPNAFDLKSAFCKKNIYYDLGPVESHNADIKMEELYTYNSYSLPKENIDKIIASYKEGDKKEGLGLVFIVESFDKPNEKGNFWVVFFDIKTKRSLLSEHCCGSPVGFGLRNYWAGSIKHILKDIRYGEFHKWNKNSQKDYNKVTVK